jgi:hypothetical protein
MNAKWIFTRLLYTLSLLIIISYSVQAQKDTDDCNKINSYFNRYRGRWSTYFSMMILARSPAPAIPFSMGRVGRVPMIKRHFRIF